jgi:hypothetical protein
VPWGPENKQVFFIVCDSLAHTTASAFPTYSSLRNFFFVEKTRPCGGYPKLNTLPMTMSFYPLLQIREESYPLGGAERHTKTFMETVVRANVESMERNDWPFFGWPEMVVLLDSIQ